MPHRREWRGQDHDTEGICGLQPVKSGTIRYAGQDITGKPAFELVRQGLAMVPEGRGVFGALTIEENLAMGAYIRRDQKAIGDDVERVFKLFHGSRNDAGRPPARCRVVSSKCWRSVAR